MRTPTSSRRARSSPRGTTRAPDGGAASDPAALDAAAQAIETAFERRLAARGRGLRAKIASVERRLPDRIVSHARRIAAIRDRAHENGVASPAEAETFAHAVVEVTRYLDGIGRPPPPASWTWRRFAAGAAAGLLICATFLILLAALAG